MKKPRVEVTSKVSHIEWLFGGDPNAIVAQEKRGQKDLVNSAQLPLRTSSGDALVEYGKMGIVVNGFGQKDDLFGTFDMPAGWTKKSTDHHLYTNLLDANGRIRASIFYKAAYYDRSAHVSFCTRFNYDTVTYLSQEESGHFEKKMVKTYNPNYRKPEEGDEIISRMSRNGEIDYFYGNGNGRLTSYLFEPEYIEKEENVWVPKYKDDYAKRNATPCYFQITDSGKVIYTTKDKPVFFKKRYPGRRHQPRGAWQVVGRVRCLL